MDKEKERMNQSSDVIGRTHPINKFLDSFTMLREPHDECFDEAMEQAKKSAACRIADNEDMKRRGCHAWDIEQNRLNSEAHFKGLVCEKLTTRRIVNAGTERLRAKCRGEQAKMAEADESAIQRETESEINHMWSRACLVT